MALIVNAVHALLVLLPVGSNHAPDPAAELQAAFVAALTADDLQVLQALSAGGDITSVGWRGAKYLVETTEQIVVASSRVLSTSQDGDNLRVELALEGTGVDAWRPEITVVLPQRWTLEAVRGPGGWRLVTADEDARRLAAELATAGASAIESGLNARPDLDRVQFARFLADLASDQGEPGRQAVAWVLAMARESGDRATEAYAESMSGSLERVVGDLDASLAAARRSVALAEQSGDSDVLSISRFGLGVAHWFRREHEEAVAAMLSTEALLLEARDPRRPLRSLYMAGHLELRAGRLRSGLLVAERVRDGLRRRPWPGGELDAAFLESSLYGRLGQSELTTAALERAFALAQAQGNRALAAMALFDLADGRAAAGDASAKETVARALELGRGGAMSEMQLGLMELDLGVLHLAEGNLPAAELVFEGAVERGRLLDDPNLYSAAARQLSELRIRQGRLEEALRLVETALVRWAETDLRTQMGGTTGWELQTTLGRVLGLLGRRAEAEEALGAAILEVEERRAELPVNSSSRTRFLEQRLAPYQELMLALLARGEPGKALEVAERSKARALRDGLEQGFVDPSAELSEDEKERAQALEEGVVALNRQLLGTQGNSAAKAAVRAELAAARRDLEGFWAQMVVKHPGSGARRLPDEDPLTAAIQVLEVGDVAVEFALADTETVAFVIRRSAAGVEVDARRIPIGRSELGQRVESLVEALERRDLGYGIAAAELHGLLVAPLGLPATLTGALCLIPDGPLWRLPFHVLEGPSGIPLGERVAIYYAPSLSALAAARRHGRDAATTRLPLLAIADPRVEGVTASASRAVFRDVPTGPLPDAASEARTVARLYPGAEVYVHEQGQEEIFKRRAGDFRILHLAAHGLLDGRAPMFSSILLGASGREDGFLEAREILDLELRADLAVLSACDTAGGQVTAGEGMIGMSWAFMVAGVPTTVVSQWKADSKATARLMIEFHRRVALGGSFAVALQQAQRTIREDPRYRHPFYWAPFVVIGAGGAGTSQQQSLVDASALPQAILARRHQ